MLGCPVLPEAFFRRFDDCFDFLDFLDFLEFFDLADLDFSDFFDFLYFFDVLASLAFFDFRKDLRVARDRRSLSLLALSLLAVVRSCRDLLDGRRGRVTFFERFFLLFCEAAVDLRFEDFVVTVFEIPLDFFFNAFLTHSEFAFTGF